MLNETDSSKYSRYRNGKRRSTVRKLMVVDPGYVGLNGKRQRVDRRPLLVGLGGLFTFSAFASILVLIASLIFGAYTVVMSFAASLPPADQLSNIRVDQSTKIYDRYGNLLYEVLDPSSGKRTVIPFDQIPLVMKQATISVEDPTFYQNPGVDPAGVARAFYYTFFKGDLTGGSTITQQLVKNNLLSTEVTLDRKIREAILSLEVTEKYSKDDILNAYLNTIPYGNLSYGVQAAAQSYFGKDASQLDLAESSVLAGLPQKPAEYDPCVNPSAALGRQKDVLRLMVQNGYITTSQADAASKEASERLHSTEFADHCKAKVGTVAPHFVAYVRSELEKRFGADVVSSGGLQVYTTLDPAIQKITEEEARKQIAQLKAQNVTNASVVVIKPDTGEILAMLGSVNFFDKSIDGEVNIATSLRQPGSSIKPINYVTALRKGWTPDTQILDAPVSFSQGPGLPPYRPVNYDGKFHGVVTVRTALANSLNVPAVKTLNFVGVPSMIDTAQQFGYTTFNDPSRYGLALTLGAAEVKLLEHTGAYAVFANQGKRVPPTPFLKIVDGSGKVILDITKDKPVGQQVVDPGYAYEITAILSDNSARVMEFGPYSPLHLCVDGTAVCTANKERPIAAKTGTTNDFKDNLTMGYTPELAVGVWVGNANNKPMINSTGITGAAPIWHNVFARIYSEVEPYKSIPPHPFPVPPNMVQVQVAGRKEWLLPQQVGLASAGVYGTACSYGTGGTPAPSSDGFLPGAAGTDPCAPTPVAPRISQPLPWLQSPPTYIQPPQQWPFPQPPGQRRRP